MWPDWQPDLWTEIWIEFWNHTVRSMKAEWMPDDRGEIRDGNREINISPIAVWRMIYIIARKYWVSREIFSFWTARRYYTLALSAHPVHENCTHSILSKDGLDTHIADIIFPNVRFVTLWQKWRYSRFVNLSHANILKQFWSIRRETHSQDTDTLGRYATLPR